MLGSKEFWVTIFVCLLNALVIVLFKNSIFYINLSLVLTIAALSAGFFISLKHRQGKISVDHAALAGGAFLIFSIAIVINNPKLSNLPSIMTQSIGIIGVCLIFLAGFVGKR